MGRQRDLYGSGVAKVLTRRSLLDKEKAITTAKNPSNSKFGNALLTNNALEGRVLDTAVNKLEREHKRRQMHIDQAKKQFIQQQQQLPEPTLIVVRPVSPEVIRRFLYSADSEDPPITHSFNEPSYMHGLRSKAKTPSLLPTIDAFAVKVKKKKNVWEEAMLEREKLRFTSAVQPCWPLSEGEQAELRRGWEVHTRPKTALTPSPDKNNDQLVSADSKEKRQGTPKAGKRLALPPPEKKSKGVESKKNVPAETPYNQEGGDNHVPTFITEIPGPVKQDTDPKQHNETEEVKCVSREKSVRFNSREVPENNDQESENVKRTESNRSSEAVDTASSKPKKGKPVPHVIVQTRTTMLRNDNVKKPASQPHNGNPKKRKKDKRKSDLGALREMMKY